MSTAPRDGTPTPQEVLRTARPVPLTFEQRMAKLKYTADVIPLGDRQEFTALARQAVEMARSGVLADLASDEFQALLAKALKKGVRAGDRTALNIAAKALKLNQGNELRIIHEFLVKKGVRDEAELDRKLELGRSVEGTSPHEAAERCLAYLERYLDLHSDQRETAVRRLGGLVAVEQG